MAFLEILPLTMYVYGCCKIFHLICFLNAYPNEVRSATLNLYIILNSNTNTCGSRGGPCGPEVSCRSAVKNMNQ